MIPIFILPGPIILDYAFFYALGDLAPSRCVTGGLCDPRDDHLFTSRTNGALCRQGDAGALTLPLSLSHPRRAPCQSPSHGSCKPAPTPLRRRKGTFPGMKHVAGVGGRRGHHAPRCFPGGRWLETTFTREERTELCVHGGRVSSSPGAGRAKLQEARLLGSFQRLRSSPRRPPRS